MKTTDKILIIDLEATCWQDKAPAGEVNEIIEIGIAVVDVQTGEITNNEGILIKPTQSKVSPFCTELTTITQEMLDIEGITFDEACKYISDNYSQYTWASYGEYDRRMTKKQCKKKKIEYPFSDNHINVKELFASIKKLEKPTWMSNALEILGISLEGTLHRGVDDAKNIAKILYWCLENNKN